MVGPSPSENFCRYKMDDPMMQFEQVPIVATYKQGSVIDLSVLIENNYWDFSNSFYVIWRSIK